MARKTKAEQKKLRDWLKAHGHKAAAVDAEPMDTDADVRAAILRLHGVEPAEYAVALAGRPAR